MRATSQRRDRSFPELCLSSSLVGKLWQLGLVPSNGTSRAYGKAVGATMEQELLIHEEFR